MIGTLLGFDDALRSFVQGCQRLVDVEPAMAGRRLTIVRQRGGKRVKIVAGSSAWAFVDVASGDILKAETWHRPAKHASGNIFSANPLDGVTAFGPRCLR